MADDDGRNLGEQAARPDDLGFPAPTEQAAPQPHDVLDGPPPVDALDTSVPPPADPEPAASSVVPSAQTFQDLIALRREAEESAAAALVERREATTQASRIIEEAMRASESLQAEAQRKARRAARCRRGGGRHDPGAGPHRGRRDRQGRGERRPGGPATARRGQRRARAPQQRAWRRSAAPRRRSLFAEANRHAARMDEIRTRVLHGVEAATDGLRDAVRDSAARSDAAFEGASFLQPVEPAPAIPAGPVVAPAAPAAAATAAAPEPAPVVPEPPVWEVPAAPVAPPAAPITPYEPGSAGARIAPTGQDAPDEEPRRRGWRSRRS
ncbi:hypothetical protein G5V59_19560 [Nocardioides sp. W3-2-3]|uniref:hypothetical protein n=1 Tax=Nocardioides convexus TaxID=2712224 RepID=UPI0024185DFC|nr:hypothetical protein [Nocardioides convexus]NHA01309.1 hypothetical protein [Nocardioides convexus]